jgi:dienelactone hydrolase
VADHSSALAGLEETEFTYNGKTRAVFRGGAGPGVVVIHEAPGITPSVADFIRRVIDAGFTVAAPVLTGTPGKPPSLPYIAQAFSSVCVSKEFSAWATNNTSPVIEWLRALARDLHETAGGPGVGAVGMCFTGGFALAMSVDEAMRAPVLSQPSMPFPLGKKRAYSLGLSDADLATVQARDDFCMMALRFSTDPAVPDARWNHYKEAFGDRVILVDIDSKPGNPHGIKKRSHSVLTEHLVDEPGHPTRDALDRVLEFLKERLQGGA